MFRIDTANFSSRYVEIFGFIFASCFLYFALLCSLVLLYNTVDDTSKHNNLHNAIKDKTDPSVRYVVPEGKYSYDGLRAQYGRALSTSIPVSSALMKLPIKR